MRQMGKPVLAAVLLMTMAGAWTWVLWPAIPTPAATSLPPTPGASQPPVPRVRLERLGRSAAGVDANRLTDPFRRPHAGDGSASRPALPPASDTAPAVSAPEPPPWPRLELIGVAESQEGGRAALTAIVSGPAGVLHARPGDVLERVYRVERLDASGIDVRLLPEDRLFRLALRP